MAEKSWNKNVRFNRNSESAMQAWSLLHSDEVEKEFKSQNEFVICAINDYYERHLRKKRDPYLETREKEDAFVERIVAQVAEKTLANLPTLAGMPSPANGNGNGRIKQGHTAEAVLGESAEEEPEDNEFLDYSFGV